MGVIQKPNWTGYRLRSRYLRQKGLWRRLSTPVPKEEKYGRHIVENLKGMKNLNENRRTGNNKTDGH
jgi:hypothetical protein